MFREEAPYWIDRVRRLDALYEELSASARAEVDRMAAGLFQPTSVCAPELGRDNGLDVASARDTRLARRLATERSHHPSVAAASYPGMIYVSPSTAPVGVDAGMFAREEPARTRRVAGFWIDAEPVTNAAYEAVLGPRERPVAGAHDDDPVTTVNWFEAHRFCAAVGKRLPLRDEWEVAARGPHDYLFAEAMEFDAALIHAWPATGPKRADRARRARGGCADMVGNVWEWTWEIFRHEFEDHRANYYSMIRGGSWRHCASSTRVVSEMVNDLIQRADNVGFRCVIPAGEDV